MNRLFLQTVVLAALLLPAWGCGSSGTEPEVVAVCSIDSNCPMGEECGSGGCVPIAPTLYPHIQTASVIFREPIDAAEADWRAAHNDLLVGRLMYWADDMRAVNPNLRLFEYFLVRYNRDKELGYVATDWALANGEDPEDFYLHYRQDTPVPTWEGKVLVQGFPPGVVPGWNPDRQPGDPPASATDRSEARIPGFDVGTPEPQYLANITLPAYRRFLHDVFSGLVDGSAVQPFATGILDGVLTDLPIYYPAFDEGVIENSDEFYGVPLDDNHPYAIGFETLQPELATALSRDFGRTVRVIPNYGDVWWLSQPDRFSQNIQKTTPWEWAEVWIRYRGISSPTLGGIRAVNYERDYEVAIANVVRQTWNGGRRILGARDLVGAGVGSERGKLFTLALYYLVHNANTYYAYETVEHHDGPGHLSVWQWNPAVEFDIGYPVAPPAGILDFDGKSGTTEHYIAETGSDPYNPALTYHLLARRFSNALVLAKMLPAGSVVDDRSQTTHALDGPYMSLRGDGSLGPVVTEVTLRNNEGAILIPAD